MGLTGSVRNYRLLQLCGATPDNLQVKLVNVFKDIRIVTSSFIRFFGLLTQKIIRMFMKFELTYVHICIFENIDSG